MGLIQFLFFSCLFFFFSVAKSFSSNGNITIDSTWNVLHENGPWIVDGVYAVDNEMKHVKERFTADPKSIPQGMENVIGFLETVKKENKSVIIFAENTGFIYGYANTQVFDTAHNADKVVSVKTQTFRSDVHLTIDSNWKVSTPNGGPWIVGGVAGINREIKLVNERHNHNMNCIPQGMRNVIEFLDTLKRKNEEVIIYCSNQGFLYGRAIRPVFENTPNTTPDATIVTKEFFTRGTFAIDSNWRVWHDDEESWIVGDAYKIDTEIKLIMQRSARNARLIPQKIENVITFLKTLKEKNGKAIVFRSNGDYIYGDASSQNLYDAARNFAKVQTFSCKGKITVDSSWKVSESKGPRVVGGVDVIDREIKTAEKWYAKKPRSIPQGLSNVIGFLETAKKEHEKVIIFKANRRFYYGYAYANK